MKRLISWLLALTLIVGLLPMSVFAVEVETEGDDDFTVDMWELQVGGSEANPLDLTADLMNEGDSTATVTIPAGKTLYCQAYRVGGMYMTINDGEAVECVTTGMMYPYTWTITNDGEAEAEYTIKVAFPEGHQQNPKVIESMSWYNDEVVQAEGDNDGFFYIYTAPADGTITLYFSAVYDDEGNAIDLGNQRNIMVTNNTTYAQYDLLQNGVDNYGLELQVPVAAGDEIIINTAWVQDADGNYYPEATYSWNGNFAYPAGTVNNPIALEWAWDDANTTATASTTTEVDGTYYTGTAGMILTVDGEEVAMDEMGVFTLNAGEHNLVLSTPVGAQANPEVIEDMNDYSDSNSLAADGSYYYIWTATEDGTVTLDVTDGANLTVDKLTYTEDSEWPISTQYTLAEPEIDENWNYTGWTVAENLVIEVVAGEQLKIQVNALTDWATWTTPAIDYTLTGDFEAAPKCEHANTTTTNTATCTEAGVETVVCDDCGETVSTTEVPALGHDYTGENGACIRCGEYQVDETLVFYNKAMLLGADIRGIFQVRKIKATSPYESFKVIVEKNGVETELELVATSDKTNYTTYGYALTVPAKEMADVVNAQIIGIKADGTYCVSNPDTWSIKIGTIALMDTYSAKTDEASVNKMKLCANMLNYGAEAQKKFSYNLDNLATDGLSDEYAAYIITTTPEMETIAKTDDTGATAPLKDIVFNLAARVQVLPRFTVAKTDAKEDYKAVINQTHIAPDGTVTVYDPVVIDGADCIKSSSTFAVYIDYLATKELRDVMTITLYKGDEVVSATHTFSAESVLYGLMDSYPTLIPALMNFCDCARAVFG